MRTIRRIYVYLVSFVSLGVIVWGVIGLARTTVHLRQIGGTASDLAGSLALTLVGVPVFLLHWGMAQRSAARDVEERLDRTRGVFFYAALAGTLIPAVQSGMALVNRLLLILFRLPVAGRLVGSNQDPWDNGIALLINALAAVYLFSVLLRDRRQPEVLPVSNEVRRLYRAVWLLYGLGLTILGVQMLVTYILTPGSDIIPARGVTVANAVTLLVAGLPIWLLTWRSMQAALDESGERDSLLRWVVLFILSLAGVGTVLTSAGLVLAGVLNKLLGASMNWTQTLSNIRQPFSLALPLGGVWAYYGSILQRQIATVPATNRRAELRRLYNYILSAFGIGTLVSGLILLSGYLVGEMMQSPAVHIAQSGRLANALAVLAVGLPLWLIAWRPMAVEAALPGDDGDRARRSPIRKAYLYLALFAGVIGSMVSAWGVLSPLFKVWFGNANATLRTESLTNLAYLVIFLVFLAYHWVSLRADGRAASEALALRQSQFGVLVLATEEEFLGAVQTALHRQAPHIPVTVHNLAQGMAGVEQAAFQAVVLPASLAIHPSPDLRAWLDGFQGERLVLPASADGWAWVGSGERSLREWAEQTAHAVRLRAEGLPLRAAPSSSPWVMAGYIFGALFGVEVLILLASLLLSTVFR
ncbi:hypothetical protein LARV_03539 [Longilinea arvoryzae]|uniref:DUF5671 domain-containing protein n=1 Tax=Longilinea arvoryzae TaxID=360412 RepID=A0A0S7BM35_9CHLR|nr:DUF5671 domain-containing protein [Longilinea arvoryzae]GAP15747.1 hypothetical protein LARV_03539 [Longilinea arvoryzae]